jgi:hypothetical protein
MSTGPEISDHSPTFVEKMTDLDHLRLRAPSALPTRTRSARTEIGEQLELERPVDHERPADVLRDEGFDAALVPTRVGDRDVEHDREERGSTTERTMTTRRRSGTDCLAPVS